MKKIYYLLAFIAVATVFSACNPLDNTYKQLGDLPTPSGTPQTFALILAASDYGILPTTNYAKTSLNFKTSADATSSIPTILASKYPAYANTSSVTVTYAVPPIIVKPVDSVIADAGVSYTAVNPGDYTPILGASPKFIELTTAQAITLLNTKYAAGNAAPFGAPVEGQIVLLTYIFFESGVVSAATTLTDTFLFTGGVWVKCYTISAAQFASVGNTFGDFSSSDLPLIPTYLSAILKADNGLTLKAKAGDIKYVAYKYFGTKTSQRVQVLTFDGTKWIVNSSLPQSITFAKTNNVWVADNTVNYKLTTADYAQIKTMPTTVNIQTALDNVAQFGDYNITVPVSPVTGWTDAQVNASIVLILAHDYPGAVANQKFVITYVSYNGATSNVTKTFIYNGTTFVYTP
jgi:hypothetical protein